MADNKPYGRLDIERYLQQQMSPAEMYAFEKALSVDPFLSDALDGYRLANADTTAHHLTHVQQQLTVTPTATVKLLTPRNNIRWLNVAAIFMVMLVGGYLTYTALRSTKGSDGKEGLAQGKTINQSASQERPTPFKNDGPVATNADTTFNKPVAKSAKPAPQPDKSFIAKEKQGNTATAEPSAAMMSAPATVPFTVTADSKETPAVERQMRMEVSMDSVRKIPLDKADKTATRKDVASAKMEAATDAAVASVTSVKASANGYAGGAPAAPVAAAEVGFNVSKQKSTAKNAGQQQAAPVIGWNNYYQYLKTQTDSTLKADGRTAANVKIVLQFQVGRDGRPVNVNAMGNVDVYYATKAKYIIEHGPLWQQPASGTVSVTILF